VDSPSISGDATEFVENLAAIFQWLEECSDVLFEYIDAMSPDTSQPYPF